MNEPSMSVFDKEGVTDHSRWKVKSPSFLVDDGIVTGRYMLLSGGPKPTPCVRVRYGTSGPVLHLTLDYFLKNHKLDK